MCVCERERERERESVCVCVLCVHTQVRLGLGGSNLELVKVLGSQPSCEFKSHLSLAVVTLSKSLYPHCSSIPQFGWGGKKGKNISPTKIWCGPGWTSGY